MGVGLKQTRGGRGGGRGEPTADVAIARAGRAVGGSASRTIILERDRKSEMSSGWMGTSVGRSVGWMGHSLLFKSKESEINNYILPPNLLI